MTRLAAGIDAASAEDAAAIAGVHVACWREAYAGMIPAAVLERLSVEQRRVQWQDWLADPSAGRFVRVARDPAAGIVGFVLATAPRSIDFADRELGALYLAAAHHGRGIGAAMMRAAVDDTRGRGCAALGFWVLAANRVARRFYEAGGARRVAERVAAMANAAVTEVGYRLDV